jgi:hypothetical protein
MDPVTPAVRDWPARGRRDRRSAPNYRLYRRRVLRLYTQRRFDGGRPGADCLTPQLRTNGHLATDYERNLLESAADSQGMPYAAEIKD